MKYNHSFDATYGYTAEGLRGIRPPPEPADFDSFWQATRAEADLAPLDLRVRRLSSASPRHEVSEVRYRTLGGLDLGAWLVHPRGRPVKMGAVMGHGYGGRDAVEYPQRDAAFLFTCAPGFSLSAAPGLPNTAGRHVVHGLQHRDTYLIRHCVAALWTGARVLAELVPEARAHMIYMGDSFGGGTGALALPWEPLFRKAYLAVPTFGHQPLRLTLACEGSGEFVRHYVRHHPEAVEVLRYFDAATAATRIRIPVLGVPALFDPAVPPPGQFAVINALAGPKEVFELSAGHFTVPESDAEYRDLSRLTERFLWMEAPLWTT